VADPGEFVMPWGKYKGKSAAEAARILATTA
jgi:hypothetical protein